MNRRYLLGFDVGSSSVKASLVDVESGEIASSAFYPEKEAPIMAVKAGSADVVGECKTLVEKGHERNRSKG